MDPPKGTRGAVRGPSPPGPWSLRDAIVPSDLLGGFVVWGFLLAGASSILPGIPTGPFMTLLPIVAVVNLLEGLYASWLAAKRERAPALWLLLTLFLGYIALVRVRQLEPPGGGGKPAA